MISKKLDDEIEPYKPVSKDHTRANRVGVNLEQLESMEKLDKPSFRHERRSVDINHLKKKKLQNSLHQRKLSQFP